MYQNCLFLPPFTEKVCEDSSGTFESCLIQQVSVPVLVHFTEMLDDILDV